MSAEHLSSQFDDKVLSAQSSFRAIMDATARPGRIHRIAPTAEAPAPMMRATAALAQALFDHDTPIWLDATMRGNGDAGRWLRFHTGAPLTSDAGQAEFALIGDVAALPALETFALGSSEYPDRSTALVVQIRSFNDGPAFELKGPGIDGSIVAQADAGLSDLFEQLAANARTFPRGIDVVLVADDAILAIPRSTRLRAMEG